MSQISRYVLCDWHGVEQDYEYANYADAERDAARERCAVIERLYTYEDSELIWTPDGEDTWPPDSHDDAEWRTMRRG